MTVWHRIDWRAGRSCVAQRFQGLAKRSGLVPPRVLTDPIAVAPGRHVRPRWWASRSTGLRRRGCRPTRRSSGCVSENRTGGRCHLVRMESIGSALARPGSARTRCAWASFAFLQTTIKNRRSPDQRPGKETRSTAQKRKWPRFRPRFLQMTAFLMPKPDLRALNVMCAGQRGFALRPRQRRLGRCTGPAIAAPPGEQGHERRQAPRP